MPAPAGRTYSSSNFPNATKQWRIVVTSLAVNSPPPAGIGSGSTPLGPGQSQPAHSGGSSCAWGFESSVGGATPRRSRSSAVQADRA